jgi:Fe2+ transport system protein FeoA
MTLVDLTPGARARVESIAGEPALLQRLSEFGLFEGEEIEFLGFAPLGDPLELRVNGTRLSLRNQDAASVTVTLV